MLFHDSDNRIILIKNPVSLNKYTRKKVKNGREYGLTETGETKFCKEEKAFVQTID